jgi:hypothetical protein
VYISGILRLEEQGLIEICAVGLQRAGAADQTLRPTAKGAA